MLVKLYDLPGLEGAIEHASAQGIVIRRALSLEKPRLVEWIQLHFTPWVAEVEVAFSRLPVACFVALRDRDILGFACYDATCRNFFGPEGVLPAERGRGLGRGLLLAALHAQRAQGYAYSIIGGVGPAQFYARTVKAVLIEASTPGLYAGILRAKPPG